MRRIVLALSLTVAFLVGCLTATVATQLVVPPIKAGTNPQKWEYTCISNKQKGNIIQNSNELGNQGWEMVAASGSLENGSGLAKAYLLYCFKRPLP